MPLAQQEQGKLTQIIYFKQHTALRLPTLLLYEKILDKLPCERRKVYTAKVIAGFHDIVALTFVDRQGRRI